MKNPQLITMIPMLAALCIGTGCVGLRREGVVVRPAGDRVRIEIQGELFSEYWYEGVSRPFLYPVLGPEGIRMTRHWPIEEKAGEDRDHPHHKSLWYAHGAVNGHDFWSESPNAGRTVHLEFLELSSGREAGVIRSRNRLIAKDGTVIATDERTLRIHNRTGHRLFDFEVTIQATHGELTFGDTKEGTMAVRLAETMRLTPNQTNRGQPGGHIVTSAGVRDQQTWGTRAAWVDYHGPVEGETVGMAIFDHPENPRHPTWWHVRDYGLFAANPFGIHDFEKKPAGTGDFRVPAGGSVTFRYRFYIHRGDEREADVAGQYEKYVATGKPAQRQARGITE
jgi:hypothetical protein